MSPKTKYVLFNMRKSYIFSTPLKYHEISCVNENCLCPSIEMVEEIKYLGLVLDSNQSWKNHINYIKNKLLRYLRILFMLKSMCNPELLKMLYYAFINSRLEYGISIWGGTYITTIKTLTTLQKRFIRLILKKTKLEHTKPLFKQSCILPIKNLYIYKVLKLFFNKSSKERDKVKPQTMSLRAKLNVPIPRPNFTFYQKYFSYIAPKFFNALPNHLKEINVKKHFLKQMKDFLLQNDDFFIL